MPCALALAACRAGGGPTEQSAEPCPSPAPAEPAPTRILVLSDRTGRPDDGIFESALRQGAKLRPDLILSVGDLIDGYQPDDEMDQAEAEWDGVLGMIRRFLGDKPFFTAAGNHDVWSDASEELFEKRLGHGVNFAFDAGGARVILLDSSRAREEADIAEDELDWLWRELRAAKDKSARIVVTHVPLWAIGPGGVYGSKLHDVLVAGRADWVLTGHWHHAMSDDRDGVRYRMLGPSGTAPNRPGHSESGNFPQFGLLTIDGSGAEVSIIEVGSIMPSDSFPYEFNQLEWKIENRAIEIRGFEIDPLRPKTSGGFTANITNVVDEDIDTTMVLENHPGGWRVRPARVAISLKPGESKRWDMNFSRPRSTPLFPGPRVTIEFPWPGGESYELARNLSPKLVRAVKASALAPEIDGVIDEAEWRDAEEIGQLTRNSGPPIASGSTIKVAVARSVLYVGARLEEPDMAGQRFGQNLDNDFYEDEDHIAVLIDPDPSDQACLQIIVNFTGKVYLNRVNTSDGYTDPYPAELHVEAKAVRESDFWAVEIAIPLEDLGRPPASARGQEGLPFNFGRSRVRQNIPSRAYWQPLKEHDVPSFGELRLR